jgi:hypothetical protein
VFAALGLVLAPVFAALGLVLAPVFAALRLVLAPVFVALRLLPSPGVPVKVKTLLSGLVAAAGLVLAGFEGELAALFPLLEPLLALHRFSRLRVTPR